MHHPCFFDFFYSNHADDGFQLHDGPFFLFRSRDIASGPLDEFLAFPKDGIYYNSKPVPSNNCGKYRKLIHTTGTESQLDAKQICLHACKQPEDIVGKKCCVWASVPDVCGSSTIKPEVVASGFLFLSFQNNFRLSVKNSRCFSMKPSPD